MKRRINYKGDGEKPDERKQAVENKAETSAVEKPLNTPESYPPYPPYPPMPPMPPMPPGPPEPVPPPAPEMRLARAYVLFQTYGRTFDPAEGLMRGTIFPELYMPYEPAGHREI